MPIGQKDKNLLRDLAKQVAEKQETAKIRLFSESPQKRKRERRNAEDFVVMNGPAKESQNNAVEIESKKRRKCCQ